MAVQAVSDLRYIVNTPLLSHKPHSAELTSQVDVERLTRMLTQVKRNVNPNVTICP